MHEPTPKELLEIHLIIAEILKGASRLYVGRTNFPERRLLEHVADDSRPVMHLLWRSWDQKAIANVEEGLIDGYSHLYRLENRRRSAKGSWGEGPHFIYLNWCWKTRSTDRAILGFNPSTVVTVPRIPRQHRFLQSPCTEEQARAALLAHRFENRER